MTTALPAHLDRDLAIRAYANLSHFPERRADGDIGFFHEAVEGLRQKMETLAKTDAQRALIPEHVERYQRNYAEHQTAIWHAMTRTASAFIVGPARFPTESNRKRGETVDRRRAEFQAWNARAQDVAAKAILDARTPEQMTTDDWRKLQHDFARDIGVIKAIDDGTKPYTRSAFVNSLAGKLKRLAANGERELVRRGLSFIREQQTSMAKPIFMPSHSAWSLEQTAAEAVANKPTGEVEIVAKEGLRVVANHDADRIQIFFDGKPDEQTRVTLKGAGWHWSPRFGAWQRKATNAAVFWAKQFAAGNLEY
jgi:hypothetical protein